MNRIFALSAEGALFAGLFLLAGLITWPLRRKCRDEETRPGDFGSAAVHVCGYLSRPLLILALSGLFHWLFEMPWIPESHWAAWKLFWYLVLVVAFVEGVAVQFYRLRGRVFPVPDLLRNLIRGALILVAAFVVLAYVLSINIAPLLGASALITAVVGFALQGVLGNLLAGMSLHIVRSVVPGDWVSLGGDTEGEVIQTNWRETRLRTVAGHIIVVPNSKVAEATIHNMTAITPLRRHKINVGASYSDPPAAVNAALVDSALAVPEVLRDPAPTAYLTEYKDFGINYQLRFWTNRYFDRTAVEGDVQRMIWYQFKRRGIEIPFPMSDKLLNDLVEVIDHRRRLAPEEEDVGQTAKDLLRSEFAARLLVDEAGKPLLKESDLLEVARRVRRLQYTAGETVFSQGEAGETCCVLVSGQLKGRVEYTDSERANEFDLAPGALFGEMSLVTGLPRTASIRAVTEAEVLEISKEAFTKLLSVREDIPSLLAKLVADRAAKNAAALEKLKAMGPTDVAETIQRDSILKRFLRMLGYK